MFHCKIDGMKKIVMVIVLCITTVLNCYAENDEEQVNTEEVEEVVVEERVVDPYGLSSPSACLIQENGGKVVYEKNAEEEFQPESLTKLMGIYLGCEKDLNDEVTMSSAAFETYDHNKDVLWIQEGEILTVRDLVETMMLVSSNDTTAMLAECVSGSNASFVSLMNDTASELHLSSTSFTNVFGLREEGMKTSCKDLGRLVSAGLENSNFYSVFTSKSYEVKPTNKQPSQRPFKSMIPFFDANDALHDETVLGAKACVGEDGRVSVVAYANQEGLGFVGCVSGASDVKSACIDLRRMFARGFESYQIVSISKDEIGSKTISLKKYNIPFATVKFVPDADFEAVLPVEISREQLSCKIEVLDRESDDPDVIHGDVVFYLDDKEVTRVALVKEVENTMPKVLTRLFDTQHVIVDVCSVIVLVLFILMKVSSFLKPPVD